MADTTGQDQQENVKYRKVTPSQLARDNVRANQYKSKIGHKLSDATSQTVLEVPDHMDTECKQSNTALEYSNVEPIQQVVKPKLSPRKTRSRASSKAKPSPVPQVDGNIDSPYPYEASKPQQNIYDGSQPWEKDLLQYMQENWSINGKQCGKS